MSKIEELYQTADWKNEKHVPVIEIIGETGKDKPIMVQLSVGKEISHPNTTEHHIKWMELYFKPDDGKFPYQIGKINMVAHGASAQGPDTSTIYTDPVANFTFRTEKSGTIIANSYCNIHGLWTNELKLKVQ
jgi:superoxide reductase